jgi:hypothetical protein
VDFVRRVNMMILQHLKIWILVSSSNKMEGRETFLLSPLIELVLNVTSSKSKIPGMGPVTVWV